MISRLGLRISEIFRRTAPDPFVLVVLLSILTVLLALVFGHFNQPSDAAPLTIGDKSLRLLDAWRGNEGLWKFLAFGMQMALVLVTGHALACSRPVHAIIARLAALPRTTAQAAAMVGFAACTSALLNWGLGLVVGALLAREVGRSMHRRGIPCHYPLLCAAGYTGLLIWHGGLSGSAPLSMTSLEQAARVLPKAFVEQHGESLLVGLDRTTFSSLNAVVTLGLLAIVPIALLLLAPRDARDMEGIDRFGLKGREPGAEDSNAAEREGAIPDWLDRTPILAWAVAVPLALGLYRFLQTRGWATLGLNEIIAGMFCLGLIMHGSLRSYAAATEEGARESAGVMLQFPLYGGILAMMSASGLVEQFSVAMAAASTERTLPLGMFGVASVLNMFITSGGGLWGVMGPIALTSGAELGVPPEKMVMAVAYGDQVTNMLQPFWALPLLAITGAKARDIVGYTALVMLAAGAWIGLWLVLL